MNFSKRNIFIYKRTHTGDPTPSGIFGKTGDCEGRLRNNLDIVIGIGGIGSEPREYEIDRKINWIGVGAKEVGTEAKNHCEIPENKKCRGGIESVATDCDQSSCSTNFPEPPSNNGYRGLIWEFEKFELYEENGPLLENYAPKLASRFYGSGNPPHHLKDMGSLSEEERNEIDEILQRFINGDFKNHIKYFA